MVSHDKRSNRLMPGEDSLDTMAAPRPDDDRPSMLSRFFGAFRDATSPEDRTDATLSDVADSSLKSLYQLSQRHKPSVEALLNGYAQDSRQEMFSWLLQAFDIMHFADNLLFETALLLDRYYSLRSSRDGVSGARQRLLAAVCTSLKTGSTVEQLQCTIRQVVLHLGQHKVPFEDVLVAELAMLRQLRFQIGIPTAKDFLDTLSTRLDANRIANNCTSLADFLLQLTLIDPALHYRYPHAILAASALALALYSTHAPQSIYSTMLEDLSLHLPDTHNLHHLLVQCSREIHSLWLDTVDSGCAERSKFASHLCEKFRRSSFNAVSTVLPPLRSLTSVPPCWSLPEYSASQDHYEEAILVVSKTLTSENQRCVAVLSDRIRSLAESSCHVRLVLTRHGWLNGRFRRVPDRESLIHDLVRSSARRTEKGRLSSGSHTGSGSPASVSSTMPSSGSISGICSGDGQQMLGTHLHVHAEEGRRRAVSCCGQRSGARNTCHNTRSSSPAGLRGLRGSRAASRSPS